MSPVAERIERLEEWRVHSERNAARLLERVGTIARSLERVASSVEGLTEEISADRAARGERRRLRAIAYAAATLIFTAAGALAGRGL